MLHRTGVALVALLVLACLGPTAQAAKVGAEFQVNTQRWEYQFSPAVAALKSGGFVAAWVDNHSDTGDVKAQRYNAAGQRVGREFRVNTYTKDSQERPSVAGLANGGFVIVWQSGTSSDPGQDGRSWGIYGQRYAANGARVGREFRVNTNTVGAQRYPSVAGLTGGGFVVTWTSRGDGSGTGIYAQRYNSVGTRIGTEFLVNKYTTRDQSHSHIAGLKGGGFVIVWTSQTQDGVGTGGAGTGAYGRRYTATGQRLGNEFRVNETKKGSQGASSVTGFSNGGFVVTWVSWEQDGDLGGVYGQRYNAAGRRTGPVEFRINTTTAGNQTDASVTTLNDGGFVVAWTSPDGSGTGIYLQRYDSAGAAVGGESRVNANTTYSQGDPAVARLGDGGFVVIWTEGFDSDNPATGRDGEDASIFGQRYDSAP